MKPAFKDDWATVYSVDALTGASLLPEKSVHTIITSPPYWNLRSYLPSDHPDKAMELGAEKTPELYVERLVEVFRAFRRVLRDDGTLWLNLGDSYSGAPVGSFNGGGFKDKSAATGGRDLSGHATSGRANKANIPGVKPKDLIGLPWLTAFALRADGWYLRSDIIWSKPSCMPESVTDRPTKSHEYMFLLTKSPRYYFDQEAVREKPSNNSHGALMAGSPKQQSINGASDKNNLGICTTSRNIRSVWSIATRPYPGSHYATFPPGLVYPCIKAGTSERGVCEKCGAPWERLVEKSGETTQERRRENGYADHAHAYGGAGQNLDFKGSHWKLPPRTSTTVGWQPTCSCSGEYIKEPYEASVVNRETGEPETFTRYRSVYVPGIPLSEHPVIPATVLDPFVGSGTSLLAARKLGRKSVGLDLDERNIKQIEERLGWQGVMF